MEPVPDGQALCPHCGYNEEETDERLDQLKPGSMLNMRFTVGRPLGRGGFGITYIAWDNSLQRKVAIKEYLPRGLAVREPGSTTVSYDEETKESFLRGVEKTLEESRRLAGFSELESVVNVYDCFRENGTAYIVMEVLKGENAKKRLEREGTFSFAETTAIITPVLETLAKVHKTGIIHRDISPDNIYICDNGKVKLLDFGSARIAEDADERSRSIVLKHGYAPKEQYTVKGKQGPYTDIYAVCATIYKLLTGITPVESLERISGEDELRDIAELVDIPAPAAKAIMQGMAVNARDRIRSADELLARLTAKDDSMPASYYESESTVTMYVPGSKRVNVPDEPVPASKIKSASPASKGIPAKRNGKSGKAKPKSGFTVKKIVAVILALAVIAGTAVLLKNYLHINTKSEPDTPVPDSTLPIPDTALSSETESTTLTTTHIDEKLWKSAFKKYYDKKLKTTEFELSDISKIYITDIDGDGIPEIIEQPYWFPTVIYYDVDRDKVFECDVPDNTVTSYPFGEYPNMLYIDKENHCLIEKCETTTPGTMAARNAAIYSYKNGKLTEIDKLGLDFDFDEYDLSDEAGQEKANEAGRKAFDDQYKEFVKGRKLEDFGKVATSGAEAIIKKLNSEFDGELTTVSHSDDNNENETVGFNIGYDKEEFYYNDWANIQFDIPNGWDYGINRDISSDLISGNYVNAWKCSESKNTTYKDSVTIAFYEGNIDDVISKHAAGSNRAKESLAGSEWIVIKPSTPQYKGGLLLTRIDEYKVQYYRQIDDHVVLIEIVSYNSDKRDTYSGNFHYFYRSEE